jgi:hypothetical protein
MVNLCANYFSSCVLILPRLSLYLLHSSNIGFVGLNPNLAMNIKGDSKLLSGFPWCIIFKPGKI